MNTHLQQLQQLGEISATDAQLGALLARLEPRRGDRVGLAAALTSAALREGHSYLDLKEMAGRQYQGETPAHDLRLPMLDEWREALANAVTAGLPGADTALIVEADKLYLRRYWQLESELAAALAARLAGAEVASAIDDDQLAAIEGALGFSLSSSQRDAIAMATRRCTVFISGGPGTGKTTVAAAILAAVLLNDPPVRGEVALVAPTGRAAQRLGEALQRPDLRECLPQAQRGRWPGLAQASTLHRLLGLHPLQGRARFGPDNPLPQAIVIVDEASMIDLDLMARLVVALRADARLIVLGDPHQLSSVQAGAVLAEISSAADRLGVTRFPLQPLQVSHRFGEAGAIARLAEAVRTGDSDGAIQLLLETNELGWETGSVVESTAAADYLERYGRAAADSVARVFDCLNGQRWLCAHRRGPHGAEPLDAWLQQRLAQRLRDAGLPEEQGRPLLVTHNRPDLGLANGDIGVTWGRVHFGATDDAPVMAADRLPETLGAHAMTVHRAQGSEFDHVGLLLPPEDSPLLSREMLYTAITRARKGLTIWASEAALRRAINTRQRRYSGLRQKLLERLGHN